ncbi:hypothetical protein NJB18091_11200 [Mycobacterium marinum]|nr:hypothetical protein NJB18091_11200 [Mycobacterium marinum]
MLVGAFLGDDGLDQDSEAIPIATPLGVHKVEKQVRARHVQPLSLVLLSCRDPIASIIKANEPRRHPTDADLVNPAGPPNRK